MNVYARNYTYNYPVFKTPDIPYRHTLVHNTPVPGIINPETVQSLADFQFHDGDILVASYQKAGSIILRVMVQMLLGLPVMEDRFHWLEIDGLEVREHSRVRGHRLLRTHLPAHWLPRITRDKHVTTTRDKTPARDKHVTFLFVYPTEPEFALSLYSHFHTSSAIGFNGDWEEFFRLWKSEKVFYGSFYRHTESWRKFLASQENAICWGQESAKISEKVIQKAAEKILKSPFHMASPQCRSHDNSCGNDVIGRVTSPSCSDRDMVTLVTEVWEYLQGNNPLTRWKSELEKDLLKTGLEGLPRHHRDYLWEQRDVYQLEEEVLVT